MASSTTASAVEAGPSKGPSTARRRPELSAPVPARRRPKLIGLGVALAVVCALAAGWVTRLHSHTTAVVVMAREVPAGAPLQAEDLRVADLNAAPALTTVPGDKVDSLVGKRTRVTLIAGQTLTPDAVRSHVLPDAGNALVGVAVSPVQLPSEALRGGDRLLLVSTPNPQEPPPAAAPPSIAATLISTSTVLDTDKTVLNVLVTRPVAALLAARAATGRLSVILLPSAAAEKPATR